MTGGRVAWRPSYDEVESDGGLVTAPDEQVAEAGAAVLRRGGNAVDAAVAAAFADGVVQPSMAGMGGSTVMTLALREPDRLVAVDGGMVTPEAATPDEFPLAGEAAQGTASFYGWPAVIGDDNIVGPKSVTVPGSVPALLQAHEEFGALPLESVLEPAVRLAADGVDVNWFFASVLAAEAEHLRADETCAELFLRDGLPLRGPGILPPDRLVQPRLAATLERLGTEGVEAFRTGAIARSLVECVRSRGGLLALEDLAAFRPRIGEAAAATFGDHVVAGVPGTGFPSVVEVLNLLAAGAEAGGGGADGGGAGRPPVVRWAEALRLAGADRARYGSTDPQRPPPWDTLVAPEYARERLRRARAGEERPDAWGLADTGTGAGSASSGGTTAMGHTSQVSVVDAAGNMVSVTQTLLNEFGSRVVDPATGIVLNDGMAYFDTRPGSLNGIGPRRWALSAMTPVVVCRDGRPRAAFGASGGPMIVSGVAQMVDAVARGWSMQEACEEPRIHAGPAGVALDERWPRGTDEALREAGFDVRVVGEGPTTVKFARPNGVLVDDDGVRRSGLDPAKPAGVAVA